MLAKLNRIASQLASIESASDAVDLRNKTKAIETYAKAVADSKDIERTAIVIRLRCERRLGELLAKSIKPGNPQLSHDTTIGLSDLGISRDQSSRYQTAAKLPAKDFEAYLDSAGNLSTNSIIKLVHEQDRQQERHGPHSGHQIITGDILSLQDRLDDDSVDLILTDPPYADLECYSNLAKLAAMKLKPGGLCLTYAGKYHLPEVMSRMACLDYFWLYAVPISSHVAIYPRRIQSAWKPILAYSRGKPDTPWTIDLLKGGGKQKGLHEWQQPTNEAEYLIEKYSPVGGLVVDPFAGSGTTLVAARTLGRSYLGCEVDSGTARMARRRLAA